MIRFKFDQAEVIDRDPPPPGTSQVIEVNAAEMIMLGDSVSLHLTCSKYPQPPIAFRTTLAPEKRALAAEAERIFGSGDVEIDEIDLPLLWNRFKNLLDQITVRVKKS